MLKCKEIVEQTGEYVDSEMVWQQRLAFRLHILMCGRCRGFVDNFKTMLVILHQSRNTELSPELIARLDRQVSKELQLAGKNADSR
ncbi:MAG: zf-HC2 domain-containing protein [Amphritea sp.]